MTQTNLMTSPVNEALPLTLFVSKEGIGQRGVRTYEGIVTYSELVDHFQIEPNSDELDEEFKKQRDVDKTRVNGLKSYWEESEGPVFPSMTFFANELDVINTQKVGNKEIVEAVLPVLADRFIGDGQGRTALIKYLLSNPCNRESEDFTIGFKLIVTDTKSLNEVKAIDIIKQVFADYHVRLKRPNKSISKHFDNGSALARLLNECLDVEVGQGRVKQFIALHGKIKRGHVWNYEQFSTMLQKFLGLTPATAKKQLAKPANYQSALTLCQQFLERVFQLLPVEVLDTDNFLQIHDKAMFTRAIFAKALGYTGRALFDEMLLDDWVTWEKLSFGDLPIVDMKDKFWVKGKVTWKDGDSIKIVKGSESRLGFILCSTNRIYPIKELSA